MLVKNWQVFLVEPAVVRVQQSKLPEGDPASEHLSDCNIITWGACMVYYTI